MKPSEKAKQLGCKSLANLAEFYGCTTQHLRNVHSRNEDAFIAMCIGYVEVSNINQQAIVIRG